MSYVLPEIVVQKLLSYGIKQLRSDEAAFKDLFEQFTQDELAADYGEKYLDEIWSWFSTTKLPVVKAWNLNAQQIPCFSVHLANETEDEAKAAVGDIMDVIDEEDEAETGTAAFTVMVDIGIHANKAGDHVLWMYYVASYILFKHKAMADRLGLKLQTFSASDYNKDAAKMGENIWTRWIRFRCTTENFWLANPITEVAAVNVTPVIGLPPATDMAAGLDVDPETVNITANAGILAGHSANPAVVNTTDENGIYASRAGDDDDSDNILID